MAGILVVGELTDDGLASITGELVAAGRFLSERLNERVTVALFSDDAESHADTVVALGADGVYAVNHPLLSTPQPDVYLAALEQVYLQTSPSVLLIGKTLLGRDLGPRIAFRLGVGVAQDCIELKVDPSTERVIAQRPVYGGNAMAEVTFPGDGVQVVVLRPNIYETTETDPGRTGEIQSLSVHLDESIIKSRVLQTVSQASEGIRLEDAAIVIGGGRGLGGPEPFEQLDSLAQLLKGAVGASRAVCDAGWLDHGYQVGLTGKTITPDLYITVAISGASQHMAGCLSAKHIVAINRDKEANIFKTASFGVVGDWNNILPSFIETVRELVDS
ncbi:electron transfer flavoprotein subunit alpha/FixB family protein [Dehalococcoidia bacterium]|nr:electron transfer flavoprotein subunit alpha/FixB family protein [Dehalococcoidia bacterium]